MYELALKRNLQVHFEKIAEEGPPHLKHYSIKLVVGKQDGNNDEETDRDESAFQYDSLENGSFLHKNGHI